MAQVAAQVQDRNRVEMREGAENGVWRGVDASSTTESAPGGRSRQRLIDQREQARDRGPIVIDRHDDREGAEGLGH